MLSKFIANWIHWLIFIIGLIPLVAIVLSYQGQSNLNRTIGWGLDITNFFWITLIWVFVMPMGYWLLKVFRFSTESIFVKVHLLFIIISMFSGGGNYSEVINWLLFLINMVLSVFNGRSPNSIELEELLDQNA